MAPPGGGGVFAAAAARLRHRSTILDERGLEAWKATAPVLETRYLTMAEDSVLNL